MNCGEHEYMNMSPSLIELATPLPPFQAVVYQHLTPDRLNISEQSALSLHGADQAMRARTV